MAVPICSVSTTVDIELKGGKTFDDRSCERELYTTKASDYSLKNNFIVSYGSVIFLGWILWPCYFFYNEGVVFVCNYVVFSAYIVLSFLGWQKVIGLRISCFIGVEVGNICIVLVVLLYVI